MKANEFVKKFGWEEAQFLLDEWDGVTTNWSLDTGFLYVDQSIDTHMLCMESLKQLIEAKELVEKHGGLFSAKCQIENECPDLEFGELEYYVDGEIFFTRVKDLDKAIADVESCQ